MEKQIELSNGMLARVSGEDFEYLAKFRWHATPSRQRWQSGTNWYACRWVELPKVNGKRKREKRYMHREVLERMGHDLTGICGDHKPEGTGTLDNRRENLRPATHKQNFAYSCGVEHVEW